MGDSKGEQKSSSFESDAIESIYRLVRVTALEVVAAHEKTIYDACKTYYEAVVPEANAEADFTLATKALEEAAYQGNVSQWLAQLIELETKPKSLTQNRRRTANPGILTAVRDACVSISAACEADALKIETKADSNPTWKPAVKAIATCKAAIRAAAEGESTYEAVTTMAALAAGTGPTSDTMPLPAVKSADEEAAAKKVATSETVTVLKNVEIDAYTFIKIMFSLNEIKNKAVYDSDFTAFVGVFQSIFEASCNKAIDEAFKDVERIVSEARTKADEEMAARKAIAAVTDKTVTDSSVAEALHSNLSSASSTSS